MRGWGICEMGGRLDRMVWREVVIASQERCTVLGKYNGSVRENKGSLLNSGSIFRL